MTKSETGTWDLGSGDYGTWGLWDVGTLGREDSGTLGLGVVGREDVVTRRHAGTQGCNEQTIPDFALNL